MSRTTRSRRGHRQGHYSLQAHQRQAFVLAGSFLIGVVLEVFRIPGLSTDWRLDTLVILLAAWGSVVLLTWWRETKSWISPQIVGLILVLLYLGTVLTHLVLGPH